MFAENKLQSLLNASAITGQLSTFTVNSTTYPMLLNGHVLPSEWGPQASTINYYLSQNVSGGLDYGDYVYYINCRAANESTSRAIASTVFNTLNRISRPDTGAVCSIMPTIPPADETDNYNTIIELRIRTSGGVA